MKNREMNIRNYLLLLLVILSFSMCVELKKDNKIKDNGVWVKLEDGARIDGYIRDGDNIYGCYVDSATNDYKSFEPLKKLM